MTIKRGEGRRLVPLDALGDHEGTDLVPVDTLSADQIYERRWALTVLEEVLARLSDEYRAVGKAALFDRLKKLLTDEPDRPSQAEIADEFGMTENAVKQAFHRVVVNPNGTRAYVANAFSSDVSVIDTSTNTVVATVALENSSYGVAITPDGGHACFTNPTGNSVSVIDTSSNTVVAIVAVGNVPYGIAISPDGSRAYVTNNQDDSVSVIDTSTNTVVATVTVGSAPYGVAITPDGTRVYVAKLLVTTSRSSTLLPIRSWLPSR